ncbi:hypothetical protein Tco_1252895 [Tanacetum coccineum]
MPQIPNLIILVKKSFVSEPIVSEAYSKTAYSETIEARTTNEKPKGANPQNGFLKIQGCIDSGCSRHMAGNMSYLTYYEEIDGGYVTFGGNPKGGKITGKYTIKTGNLDFKNEYFMDVKSAFLYGKIKEEVYVCQPPGFEDPYFLNRIYGFKRKDRQRLFLSDREAKGIFCSLLVQDKYVTGILKKFSFTNVKTTSTPMETQKLLLKDEDGEEVDVHLYRSMIGSLMYLTSCKT